MLIFNPLIMYSGVGAYARTYMRGQLYEMSVPKCGHTAFVVTRHTRNSNTYTYHTSYYYRQCIPYQVSVRFEPPYISKARFSNFVLGLTLRRQWGACWLWAGLSLSLPKWMWLTMPFPFGETTGPAPHRARVPWSSIRRIPLCGPGDL